MELKICYTEPEPIANHTKSTKGDDTMKTRALINGDIFRKESGVRFFLLSVLITGLAYGL